MENEMMVSILTLLSDSPAGVKTWTRNIYIRVREDVDLNISSRKMTDMLQSMRRCGLVAKSGKKYDAAYSLTPVGEAVLDQINQETV